MLLAVVPVAVPILAALALVGGAIALYFYAAEDDAVLEPGKQPGVLEPGIDEPGPGAPAELVDSLAGSYIDGKFHRTESGDSINAVVTKTLNKISAGRGNEPQMIGALRRLLNRSQWNRDLFGEPMPQDNYAFEGQAINRFALGKHENTIEVMELGFFPVRNIDANGKRIGPSLNWGDPWVPPLNHQAVIDGVADENLLLAGVWEDGTPATEPPPELMAVLEERA